MDELTIQCRSQGRSPAGTRADPRYDSRHGAPPLLAGYYHLGREKPGRADMISIEDYIALCGLTRDGIDPSSSRFQS